MRLAKVKLWLGFGQRQLQVPNGANYVIYGPEKDLVHRRCFFQQLNLIDLTRGVEDSESDNECEIQRSMLCLTL